MARVSAVTVAISSSGQMIAVIIDAGTTIPPIPRPEICKMELARNFRTKY